MDILDELTNKFMDEMDALLAANPQYREPELIQYLKERRLYVNEIINNEEEM